MDLTPSDIRRKRFDLVKKGGYDPDEVHAYLNEVSFVIADQHRSLMEVRARLTRLEKELEEYHTSEGKLEEAVLTASRSRNEAVTKARQEAELIVGRARREALQLLDQSRNDAEEFLGSARGEYESIQRRATHLKDVVRKTEGLLRTMAEGGLADSVVDGQTLRAVLNSDETFGPDEAFEPVTEHNDAVVELSDTSTSVRIGPGVRIPRGIDMSQAVDLLLDQLRTQIPA